MPQQTQKQDPDFFPKLESPFIRKKRDGNETPLVTSEINPGYEWVFEQADTVKAIEKIDGVNMSVTLDADGTPTQVHLRNDYHVVNGERIYDMKQYPLWDEEQHHLAEAIANTYGKGWIDYLDYPGQFFGELVGPRAQGNRYDLDKHYWVPFDYAAEKLELESYGEYGVAFDDISAWFNGDLIPLFYSKMHNGMPFSEARTHAEVEGIVFTHPHPDKIDTVPYAKLKQTMFPWYYE